MVSKKKENISKQKFLSPLAFESIKLLFENPILFVPKVLIAILYGVGTLLAVDLSKELMSFQDFTTQQVLNFDFSYFFIAVTVLFAFTIITFFIDLFFSGFYPILVSLAKKKRLSFKEAFILFKPRIFPILVSGIFLWVLLTIVSLIEAVVILNFNLSSTGFILSFIVTFVFIFIFYFLYPKIVFEDKKISKSFVESFFVSLKNKKLVFVLSLIPFSVSVIKFVLAYFSDSSSMMILFWALVLLTGVIYSIHAVINQLAYLKVSASKK